MSDNAFLISDIDDSESDELSSGYRHDTINIPDQATNSDAYIDDNQRARKSDSTIPNTIQNSIEDKPNNFDEDENNDDDDQFIMEKDENSDEEKEEKESDENIFLNESDEKNEEEEKESGEDIFLNESDEKNEEEEKVEDNDIFLNKSDENNDDDEKKNQDELCNKDNENNSDNEKMNKIIDEEETVDNKDNEAIDKANSEEDIKNIDLSNGKFSNSKEITDSNNNVSDEGENDDKKKNTSISNVIDNVAESFFNADDEKEEHYDDNEFTSNKTNKNEKDYNSKESNSNEFYESFIEKESDKHVYDKENDDKAYADESIDFADESNDFADDSNIGILRNDNLLDEMKNHDENKSNKDDSVSTTSEKDNKLAKNKVKNETIKDEDNNKKENADTKIKDDSSTSKPIVEPPQKRNEHHRHHHRHSHDKKKELHKKENEEEIKDHEEENQQKEDIPPKKDKKASKKRKNNADSEKKPEKNPTDHTIDEIVDISINDGDFSYLNQSNIEKVMAKMRQKQRNALENGDYELAEKAQLAAQSAIRYYNEKQLLKHNSNRACEINIQLEQTRNDISFLQEHWARVLENAKQKANADLLQLRDQQDLKLKEFDDKYKKDVSDPENNLPLEYRKFSSTVLALKRKREIYSSINNFKLAKEINKEIKMLEEKEKKENLLRYQKKKIAERNNMIKKQDEMFAVRRENWMRTIEGIKSVANYEISHAKKSEKQLETKYMQTNEFSNKLITQQRKRSSSLQPDKKDQKSLSTSIPNSPREEPKPVYHTQFTIQRNQHKVVQQEFRERAMINRIIYTNRVVPKVKKPIPMSRTKRQYPRTPR